MKPKPYIPLGAKIAVILWLTAILWLLIPVLLSGK